VLPTDGVPVASWKNEDEAWLNVETGLKKIIENIRETKYRRTFTQTLTSTQDVIVNELKQIDKAYSHSAAYGPSGAFCEGIPSGIRDLDFILGGFRPSDLIVVGARPSSGKTDFALNVAWNAAIEKGDGVAFFSTQTPVRRVIRRLIACGE
jgi:replicative DNA helicase